MMGEGEFLPHIAGFGIARGLVPWYIVCGFCFQAPGVIKAPSSKGNNRTQSGIQKRGRFNMHFEYDAILHEEPDGGAWVPFPWDIREVFGKGRVRVCASFDGFPYDGSIVNMGVKNPDGSVCYIIGVLKGIRKKIGKRDGDSIHVVIDAE